MPDVFGVQIGAPVAAAAWGLLGGLVIGWLSVLWFVSWRAAREAPPDPPDRAGLTFREAVDAAAAAKASSQPEVERAFADGVDAVVAQLVSRDAHEGPADLEYAYWALAEADGDATDIPDKFLVVHEQDEEAGEPTPAEDLPSLNLPGRGADEEGRP